MQGTSGVMEATCCTFKCRCHAPSPNPVFQGSLLEAASVAPVADHVRAKSGS
jgi:hypothetical protein